MNVYLEAQGCRVNEAERSSWFRGLLARGHQVVATPDHAQVVVLNTCAVTQESAKKARRRLMQLRDRQPRAFLVATGCWATLEAAEVCADLLVPNEAKDSLVDRLEDSIQGPLRPVEAEPIAAAPRTRGFVKVQDGCRHRCTYCVVTIARGAERSRPVEEIVGEVRGLASSGVKEVVLTGIHLGGYGSDLGTHLSDLVRSILDRTPVERLRLSSLEPWDLPSGFFELWADSRLCPHLHLPLQSGSDAVLKRMARRTTTCSFRSLVSEARAAIPGLNVTTDVIAGFPGETEAEANETRELLLELEPGDLHVFTYSPRGGTVAAGLPGQVGEAEKRRRSKSLRTLGEQLRSEALGAAVGQVRPVLWERRPRLAGGDRLVWRGHTDNYVRVMTETGVAGRLGNRVTKTLLTSVCGDGWGVLGQPC